MSLHLSSAVSLFLCVQEFKIFFITLVVFSEFCSGCVKSFLDRTSGREAGRRGSKVNISRLFTSLKLFVPGRRVFAAVTVESRIALNV